MSIESSIYARLKDFAALNAVVEDRIYPTTPPENAQVPCVVFTITDSEPQLHTQGVSGLCRYTLDVDVWAVNLDTTLQALEAVRQALHGYRGGQIQGAFLATDKTQPEEDVHHGKATYTVWANVGATFATAEALAANSVFAPRLTLLTDWTLHFTTSPNPERLGVFKYVNKRNKAHRRSPAFGWSQTPYSPHKGKRWELVFELLTTATTWTYPTDFSQSIRPHDNDPFTDPEQPRNLRTTGKSKRWRVGAMHGGAWHMSPEVLLYSVPDYFSRSDPNFTKLGLVS